MKRLQSIGALLTALMGGMIITIIAVCAVTASNAFDRKKEATDTLSVVVLKRSTLLPEKNLRSELGLERARLFIADKAGAADLNEIRTLHAAAETSLNGWIALVSGQSSALSPIDLDGILGKRAQYARLWPAVLDAMQKPAKDRPADLAAKWTAVVDGLSDEINAQSDRLKGKPAQAMEKILQGMREKFYQTYCLVDQGFVKNPDMTVQQHVGSVSKTLGDEITIRRFVRFQVGEPAAA